MKIITIALGLAIATAATAAPNWKRVNYTKSTIFNATVTFDGQPAEPGDIVGVFVNNECRMIAPVKFEGTTSYVSAVVHTETVEPTSIKLYRASDGKTYDADSSFLTEVHGQILGFPIRIKSSTITNKSTISASDGLVVYPSPFNESISISANEPIKKVMLINIEGSVVATEDAKGENFINFNNITVPVGAYTVSAILMNGKTLNCEVVKK